MSLENVKKVVSFGLSVGEAVLSAKSMPTVLAKVVAMLHLLEDVPVLFGLDYAALTAEVEQLTPEQLDELKDFIDNDFNVPDADKEHAIEAAIGVVVDLAKVAEKAAAMWKSKPAA